MYKDHPIVPLSLRADVLETLHSGHKGATTGSQIRVKSMKRMIWDNRETNLQYMVTVDGSGRITLRNRVFLRQIIPFINNAWTERGVYTGSKKVTINLRTPESLRSGGYPQDRRKTLE